MDRTIATDDALQRWIDRTPIAEELVATHIRLHRVAGCGQEIEMAMNAAFAEVEPTRADIDATAEPTVVEFGTPWCGFCRAAQPLIAAAFTGHPGVRHIKVEDGKGRPLGRSFGVKLWPTLIFLCAGSEVARLVRPADSGAIDKALAAIDAVG